MELLVYVRNHGGRDTGSTYVGASVGYAPSVEGIDTREPLTSSAEFRVDAAVDNPIDELQDAVDQLFAVIGSQLHARPIYVSRPRSAIRVQLEPGFDTPSDVAHELAEMLAMCSPKVSVRSRIGAPPAAIAAG